MISPHQITRNFEAALCEYTGAKYAVAVTSCTAALLLACKWHKVKEVTIPKRTYVSVPQVIRLAGGTVKFDDINWTGIYKLEPYHIYDSARYFTSGMYYSGDEPTSWPLEVNAMICVSFHWSKILGDTQGGAILHDDPVADKWFRRARFDGRTEGVAPKDDVFDMLGYHCYISPDVSARLLAHLSVLPKHNDPLPNDDYPDLSLTDWNNL